MPNPLGKEGNVRFSEFENELTETERNKDTWRYWRAHALLAAGMRGDAFTEYARVSNERSYYGFLAADQLQRNYQMNDVNATPDPNDIECSVRIGGPLDDPTLRQSTVTTFSDVYWAQSTDGGVTWETPVRVTDTSTDWCAATPINSIIPNFGDYNTSVSHGNKVFVSWADGRNAGIVDRVATAYFARIEGIGGAPR